MITLNWADFKSTILRGVTLLVETQTAAQYIIYGMGRFETLCTKLDKDSEDNTDLDDYVNNYRTLATSGLLTEFFNYRNLTGEGTTTIKSGAGVIQAVIINDNTTHGTVTIYDSTTASGPKIGTLQIGSPSGGLLSTSGASGPTAIQALMVRFTAGLTIVLSGFGNDVTVVYK